MYRATEGPPVAAASPGGRGLAGLAGDRGGVRVLERTGQAIIRGATGMPTKRRQRPRSQRSRSLRWTMPSTRITPSPSMTSYMTRQSPTRSRWKESWVPRMVFTALPRIRPGPAASTASRSRRCASCRFVAASRRSNVRAAVGPSSTRYGFRRGPRAVGCGPWRTHSVPGGACGRTRRRWRGRRPRPRRPEAGLLPVGHAW